MGGERAQSAPGGKRVKKGESSAATLDTAVLRAAYDDDEEAILATLKKPPIKKRVPGGKWDGRVTGMTLKEYRELKWGVDACYAKVERRGPSFSMRPMVPSVYTKRNDNFQAGDVFRSFNATLRTAPCFSMAGRADFRTPTETSQGPAEYPIKSSMDPGIHPTVPKNRGSRFGSEVLEPRDPPGPAPGQYELTDPAVSSTIKSIANFTIQGRESWKPPTAAPGPEVGEYEFFHSMRTGKSTPIRWNMQGRTEPLKKPLGARQYQNPGPDHYGAPGAWPANPNPNKHCPPNWKFGGEPRGLR